VVSVERAVDLKRAIPGWVADFFDRLDKAPETLEQYCDLRTAAMNKCSRSYDDIKKRKTSEFGLVQNSVELIVIAAVNLKSSCNKYLKEVGLHV